MSIEVVKLCGIKASASQSVFLDFPSAFTYVCVMFSTNLKMLWNLSLQKLLGSWCLEDVLYPAQVNPQFIVYNMTKVNKHGVVSLEDKTGRPNICLISSILKCQCHILILFLISPT